MKTINNKKECRIESIKIQFHKLENIFNSLNEMMGPTDAQSKAFLLAMRSVLNKMKNMNQSIEEILNSESDGSATIG